MRRQRYLIPESFEFPRLAEGLGNSDVYKTEKNMAYITCKNLELGYKDQIVASATKPCAERFSGFRMGSCFVGKSFKNRKRNVLR